jgi:hypothetical protein
VQVSYLARPGWVWLGLDKAGIIVACYQTESDMSFSGRFAAAPLLQGAQSPGPVSLTENDFNFNFASTFDLCKH